jgi:hypothetical protein
MVHPSVDCRTSSLTFHISIFSCESTQPNGIKLSRVVLGKMRFINWSPWGLLLEAKKGGIKQIFFSRTKNRNTTILLCSIIWKRRFRFTLTNVPVYNGVECKRLKVEQSEKNVKYTKVFFLRTNKGNTIINGMDHHSDKQIQTWANERTNFLGSEPWGSNILHRLQWIKLLSDKDAQIECLSAQVKSTAQLQARGRFTLILGLELCSLFKILLWQMNNSNKSDVPLL